MPRYKLTIEYDGTSFFGWQRQKNHVSIQEAVENAARSFCGQAVEVVGSGRTDAGVHARAQVAHLDLPKTYASYNIVQGLNFHLRPHPIAIINAEAVDDGFHARFSAIERGYEYVIINRSAPLTLEENRAWLVFKSLNVAAMNEGARYLEGKHDFSAFRAAECQSRSPIKTLDELKLWQEGERIMIKARARSFLHHQVRNMVGTLKLVGEEKLEPRAVEGIRDSKDRTKAGPTAPACGLYLLSVRYAS